MGAQRKDSNSLDPDHQHALMMQLVKEGGVNPLQVDELRNQRVEGIGGRRLVSSGRGAAGQSF